MIKTPLSTAIGGAGIWTPGCTVIGCPSNINQFIKSLFADGTQGLYLNAQDAASVSDLSSIKDLSGNNNHAAQPNRTSRATIITDPSGYKSLKFDGVDDGYVTPSINFTNTDKVTVIAAVRKLSDVASYGMVVEAFQSFSIQAPALSGNKGYGSDVKGKTLSISNLPSPHSSVITLKASVADNSASLSVGSVKVQTTGLNSGNFSNLPTYIGRRGGTSLPFNGQIYALLVIGKLLDDATVARIEKEFAKYIGVNL